MAILVDVVAVLTLCACVLTIPKETLAIAVYRCTTTSRGDMEKQTMPIHANCVTATAMQIHATIMPHLIRFLIAMIREEGECVKTARATLVSIINIACVYLVFSLSPYISSWAAL